MLNYLIEEFKENGLEALQISGLNAAADYAHTYLSLKKGELSARSVIACQGIAIVGIKGLQAIGFCLSWLPLATSINYVGTKVIAAIFVHPLAKAISKRLVTRFDEVKLFFGRVLVKDVKYWMIRGSINAVIYRLAVNTLLRIPYLLPVPYLLPINLAVTAVALTVWGIKSL